MTLRVSPVVFLVAVTVLLPTPSGRDALTFGLEVSSTVAIHTIGLTNDNPGASLYEASRDIVPATTDWNQASMPIALPSRDPAAVISYFSGVGDGGGDDRAYEIFCNAVTSPPCATNTWYSIDVPFSSELGLTTRAHLAQIILSGDTSSIFVDNIGSYC